MRDATGRMLHSTIGRRREEICSQISRLLDKAHIHLNVLSCFCWWWWWRKHPQHYSWIPELDTKSNTGSDTFPIPLLSFIHSFDRFLRLVSSTHTHTRPPASRHIFLCCLVWGCLAPRPIVLVCRPPSTIWSFRINEMKNVCAHRILHITDVCHCAKCVHESQFHPPNRFRLSWDNLSYSNQQFRSRI